MNSLNNHWGAYIQYGLVEGGAALVCGSVHEEVRRWLVVVIAVAVEAVVVVERWGGSSCGDNSGGSW